MLSEIMQNEIEKGAQHMNMTVEEATEKYTSICGENNIEVNDNLGLGLWRNFAAQVIRRSKQGQTTQSSGSNSLTKQCFGFFVALEAPRDMMSWQPSYMRWMVTYAGRLLRYKRPNHRASRYQNKSKHLIRNTMKY